MIIHVQSFGDITYYIIYFNPIIFISSVFSNPVEQTSTTFFLELSFLCVYSICKLFWRQKNNIKNKRWNSNKSEKQNEIKNISYEIFRLLAGGKRKRSIRKNPRRRRSVFFFKLKPWWKFRLFFEIFRKNIQPNGHTLIFLKSDIIIESQDRCQINISFLIMHFVVQKKAFKKLCCFYFFDVKVYDTDDCCQDT